MKKIGLVSVLVLMASVLAASSAQASTVTVGSPLTASFTTATYDNVVTVTNTSLPESGANATSPVTGAIVRWRLTGFLYGPFYLCVLTPDGGTTYTGGACSAPETPTSTATQTFTTDLPIKAGQTIGLDNTNDSDQYGAASSSAGYLYWAPPLPNGSTEAATSGGSGGSGAEFGFNADVQPAPGITSISPTSGSLKGGTSVTITGHDFTNASAVKFGGTPAASFTVNSDTQITAVSPATKTPGAIDITVTTAAGTTPTVAGDKFTYTACVVPKLKGKTLKKTRKALKKAHCKLGKVKRKGHHTKRHVKKQKPKPGTVLAPGSSVRVTVRFASF